MQKYILYAIIFAKTYGERNSRKSLFYVLGFA